MDRCHIWNLDVTRMLHQVVPPLEIIQEGPTFWQANMVYREAHQNNFIFYLGIRIESKTIVTTSYQKAFQPLPLPSLLIQPQPKALQRSYLVRAHAEIQGAEYLPTILTTYTLQNSSTNTI